MASSLNMKYIWVKAFKKCLSVFQKFCLVYSWIFCFISDFIPSSNTKSSWHPNGFNTFSCWTEYCKSSFFLSVINKGNKVYPGVRCTSYYSWFGKSLLQFQTCFKENCRINASFGIILLRLRSTFSHLCKHTKLDLILRIHESTFFV